VTDALVFAFSSLTGITLLEHPLSLVTNIAIDRTSGKGLWRDLIYFLPKSLFRGVHEGEGGVSDLGVAVAVVAYERGSGFAAQDLGEIDS
jgi:hypothetical protein